MPSLGMLDEDEYLGQYRGINYPDQLDPVWSEDYRLIPSTLTEGCPGGMIPNARTTMPELSRGTWGSTRERKFPGWNPSMPEGAIGYTHWSNWEILDQPGGPRLWLADMTTPGFIMNKEADWDWSPP
jgi:hypothetical protein